MPHHRPFSSYSGAALHCRCLSLLLLFLLTGCAGLSQRQFLPVDEGTSQEVLDSLRQKEAIISTLKGLFQVSISGSGIPISQDLNGILAYHQPDQVHLKGYVRLGVPVLDFHREGNHYELFLPAEGKIVSGQVNGERQDSEWDQTVLLSLRALDAVLGKIAGLSGSDARVLRDEQFFRIDQVVPPKGDSGSSSEVWVRTRVDAHTLDIKSIEYFQPAEDLVVSVECEDYRPVKNKQSNEALPVRLPFSVQATDHRVMGGTVTLNFLEFILNAA